ncbi:AraC family transcriptional regulator [Luteolibacter flavescens]|uniref:AraC family transcriptional regulator n=1 Tax=Luteolibacter flavescens TaxID=1859460 RepID=A0ABT3FNJ2_9BACT|nr:AraC family transcriptional regulator [Luteolibacter flavescens]MCW1885123.1 AraC family transcriptional regulator [Luteolibacter flavescens]
MKLEACHDESAGGADTIVAPATPVGGEFDWNDSRTKEGSSRAGMAAMPECNNPGIRKAIRTIRDEYSRPLTVTSLARECGMSVRSLHRLYRSATGNTIGQDLIARRVEAAATMLREDNVKLEPVAIETGLGNAKNLCRLFREHFGQTPGQWKESFHGRRSGAA